MALWEIAPLKSLHVNWQSHAPTPMVEHFVPRITSRSAHPPQGEFAPAGSSR